MYTVYCILTCSVEVSAKESPFACRLRPPSGKRRWRRTCRRVANYRWGAGGRIATNRRPLLHGRGWGGLSHVQGRRGRRHSRGPSLTSTDSAPWRGMVHVTSRMAVMLEKCHRVTSQVADILEMCHKIAAQLAGHVGMMSALTSVFWQLLLIFTEWRHKWSPSWTKCHRVRSQLDVIMEKCHTAMPQLATLLKKSHRLTSV